MKLAVQPKCEVEVVVVVVVVDEGRWRSSLICADPVAVGVHHPHHTVLVHALQQIADQSLNLFVPWKSVWAGRRAGLPIQLHGDSGIECAD